jgi:hypothetical protein
MNPTRGEGTKKIGLLRRQTNVERFRALWLQDKNEELEAKTTEREECMSVIKKAKILRGPQRNE